jgi:hypothetical protein
MRKGDKAGQVREPRVVEQKTNGGIDGLKGAKRQRSEGGCSRGPRTQRWGIEQRFDI